MFKDSHKRYLLLYMVGFSLFRYSNYFVISIVFLILHPQGWTFAVWQSD